MSKTPFTVDTDPGLNDDERSERIFIVSPALSLL